MYNLVRGVHVGLLLSGFAVSNDCWAVCVKDTWASAGGEGGRNRRNQVCKIDYWCHIVL